MAEKKYKKLTASQDALYKKYLAERNKLVKEGKYVDAKIYKTEFKEIIQDANGSEKKIVFQLAKKGSSKVLEKQYDNYLMQYANLKINGFAMDKALTKKQYAQIYYANKTLSKDLTPKQGGMSKNLARDIALEQRLATPSEIRKLEQMKGKEITVRERIKKGEEGYIPGKKTYRKYTKKFDYKWTAEDIKSKGLSRFYNYLREEGYTAREAGAYIDEVYPD